MERCEELAELTTLLAEGSLQGTEAERARAHLSECAECRAAFEETRAALAALAGARLPEPRPGLARDIADRAYSATMARRAAARRSLAVRRWAASAVAAALVLAVLSFAVYQRRDGGFFSSRPSHVVETATFSPQSSSAEDIILTALGDFSVEAEAAASAPASKPATTQSAVVPAAAEPAFRALPADMDVVDSEMSSMWGDDSADLFDAIISLTEEEAEALYNELQDSEGRTAVPYGVS